MSRFDHIQYDESAQRYSAEFKDLFTAVENAINILAPSRPVSIAMTKLEEVYMWVGKAIRDDQIKRNGSAELREGEATK